MRGGIAPLAVEPLSVEEATALARRLAPVVDVGALVDDDSDLPTTITTRSRRNSSRIRLPR